MITADNYDSIFDKQGKLRRLKDMTASFAGVCRPTKVHRLRKFIVENLELVKGRYSDKEEPQHAAMSNIMQIIKRSSAKSVLTCVASDFHGRSADFRLLDNWLNMLEDVRPDKVILNGDILDGESVSRYDPVAPMSWPDELELAANMLRRIRRAVGDKAAIHWIDGNHEQRYYIYLAKNAAAIAANAAKLSDLLPMRELSIQYHTHRQYVLLPHGMHVQHRYAVNPIAGVSAVRSMAKLGGSIMIGDTHRVGSSHILDRGGPRVGYEIGCMCKLDAGYAYEHGVNWQNGFMMIRHHGQDMLPEYNQVVAHSGRFAFEGVVYE